MQRCGSHNRIYTSFVLRILGLYSLSRRRLISIGIPNINLRRSSDRLRFIMGIPIPVRAHLQQRGAGPPAGAWAFSARVECLHWRRSARSFTICGGPISRHWVIDLSILTNQRSLLFLRVPQKNRSVSDLCGRPPRARCGGAADPRRCKQHHTISTNRSTAEPRGRPARFSALV